MNLHPRPSLILPLMTPVVLLLGSCGDDSRSEGSSNDMDLIGFWKLTSWTWTADGTTDSYAEAELDSLGIVWTLEFHENGTAEQITNLSGPLATMPGSWETSGSRLTLTLEGSEGETGSMTYDYVVAGESLTLDWSLSEENTFSAEFTKR